MAKLPKTSKMFGETEQQYIAWLLYCEVGSIPKMIKAWNQLRQGIGETSVVFGQNIKKLQPLPGQRNIEKWSARYCWVKRRDIRISEEMEELSLKSGEIRKKKIHFIVETFWDGLQIFRKQLRQGERMTVDGLKKLWEMMRAECGESLGQHELHMLEDEQSLPTPKENELGRRIDATIKAFYDEQSGAESKYSPMDNRQPNKR
jgi:hypothetical protein